MKQHNMIVVSRLYIYDLLILEECKLFLLKIFYLLLFVSQEL